MARKRFALAVFATVVLLLSACGGTKSSEDTDETAAVPVQVAKTERKSIQRTVTAEAVLYPLKQADIVPKISAPVAQFFVQRGQHVRAGQVVARLEARDLSAAAQESRQLYQQAEAAYTTTTATTLPEDITKSQTDAASAKAALDAAQRVYNSRAELFKEGALARKMVDDAKVALVQAQSQYDTAEQHLQLLQKVGQSEQTKSAQAQLAAAKAHYESAEAQLSYADIQSPIGGVVSDRPLNVGGMAAAGTPLMTVVDISQVVARANVPVSEVSGLKVGDHATISAGGVDLPGLVTVVSPVVDPNTTTVQVWVQAKNPDERLKLGLTASITVSAGEIANAVVVPQSALLASDEGGEKVMIAGSDNLAHETPVKVGVRSGDDVQILDGVKPGDVVITSGGFGLDDKAKIKLAESGGKQEE